MTLKYATTTEFGNILRSIKDVPSWDVGGTPTNEAVGTGDDSNTQFFLDQKNIVASSYTLYANAVAMTETTHYTLNLTTGEITLTGAGVTMLTTNDLTAKYQYSSLDLSDAYITKILERAETEVDGMINSTFTDGTATNPTYPTTTEIQPSPGYFRDQIIIKNKPIIDIETTLDGAHAIDVATINLASGTGANYPATGTIIIGSEAITYTGVSTDDLTGCTRGALGSTAAAYDGGEAVHSTILFLSNTSEGTAVTWTVQNWDTKTYITDEGLAFSFADSVFSGSQYPDRLTKQDVANRVKIIHLYGYNTIPKDITRLTILLAKRQLIQDNIGKSMIAGRDEFKPEMFNVDKDEIKSIVNDYIIIPMGNT